MYIKFACYRGFQKLKKDLEFFFLAVKVNFRKEKHLLVIYGIIFQKN